MIIEKNDALYFNFFPRYYVRIMLLMKRALCLLLALALFKMEIGNVQISVARIDIPMLKTAYINPGLFAKYFSRSLNQTCHENLIKFISRAAYIYYSVK